MDSRRLLVAALLLLRTAGHAQSIVTVAGGASDDGRPASLVALSQPNAVALDADGNVYVADTASNRIRRVAAKTGVISTFAGNGSLANLYTGQTGDFSGDGGPATVASLYFPKGIAFDAAGNLLIVDSGNHRVRKVTAATGIISTVAGNGNRELSGDGGPATAAGFLSPASVAIDAAGNLYVGDSSAGRVRKVDAATGIITTIAGGGTSVDDGVPAINARVGASGIALDAAGNLYIADSSRHLVRKVVAKTGLVFTVAGNGSNGPAGDGGRATDAAIGQAAAVAVDAAGNLYIGIAATRANEPPLGIRKVTPDGIISTVSTTLAAGAPPTDGYFICKNLVADAAGNLYVVSFDRVVKIAAGSGLVSTIAGNEGSVTFSGDGDLATGARLNRPKRLAVDRSGNLFIADNENQRIRKVDAASGVITTIAGKGVYEEPRDNGPATTMFIAKPMGVAVDASGNVYFAETDNSFVRKIDMTTGIMTRVAGTSFGFSGDGSPAIHAQLAFPSSVALDRDGNIYIADEYNFRVRKIAVGTGIITTIAGNGDFIASGDGGPATAAGVLAAAVTVDGAGNVYISDGSTSIRRVAAGSGIISTVVGSDRNEFSGDGGPASEAKLNYPSDLAVDSLGNLYIADTDNQRIRKVDAGSGIITTVAGSGKQGFLGDGGDATAAALGMPSGVALDASGNLFIADDANGRVRKVPKCVTLKSPALKQPADGASGERVSPKLAWAVSGAFHSDVYLDTAYPPQTLVAGDVAAQSYSPANLEPLTKYYWKVVAKGDPFCTTRSSASSEIWSFTTTGTCSVPGAFEVSTGH
jgi:sugar lactone lactonase YvrE